MKIEIEIPEAVIDAEIKRVLRDPYTIREAICAAAHKSVQTIDWAPIISNAIDKNADLVAAEVVSVALRKASAKQLQMAMKFAESSHD